jgi:hypothetical protein
LILASLVVPAISTRVFQFYPRFCETVCAKFLLTVSIENSLRCGRGGRSSRCGLDIGPRSGNQLLEILSAGWKNEILLHVCLLA